MSEALKRIEKFKRQELTNLLSQCTEPQQALFAKMYGSVDAIPEDKIPWAIKQCENTIKANGR